MKRLKNLTKKGFNNKRSRPSGFSMEFKKPETLKRPRREAEEENDLDIDELGGRGRRKGAVKDLNDSDNEDDKVEEKPKHLKPFAVHREYEEMKGEVEYDEKGTKIEAFNLDEEMEEG